MLNLSRLSKKEIIWLGKHFCRHHHSYLEHQSCLESENPKMLSEITAMCDIETTGLNANWDYIISYHLLINGKIKGRVLTREEVLNPDVLDKNLLQEFYNDLKGIDRLVVYWGKDRRHDIPFLRTRALKWGVKFPQYKELFLTDLYDIVRNKLRLHRNRLENVANFLKVPAKEHRLDAEMWQRAKLGDKKALKYVDIHNKEDVITTQQVYDKLRVFVKENETSI